MRRHTKRYPILTTLDMYILVDSDGNRIDKRWWTQPHHARLAAPSGIQTRVMKLTYTYVGGELATPKYVTVER